MEKLAENSQRIGELQTDYQKLPSALWLRSILITLAFLFLFILSSLLAVAAFAGYKVNQFRSSAGLNWHELYNLATQVLERQPSVQTNGRKNILLLGVDEVANREGHPVFTDTMILLSLDLNSGKIYTLPIPRDLWSEEYQTKINALYIYGVDRYPDAPQQFPQEVLEAILGQPIQHTLVLSLDQLAQLIDLVGGVDIEVQESFTDNEFPRTDADISSNNPKELYETVSFEKGHETMSGERALKYIRSRHSQGDEGNDLARSRRQQQVISALIAKLSNLQTLKNTKLLGKLYLFYLHNFDGYIDHIELAATVKKLIPLRNQIEFITAPLSIYPDDQAGVIEHPDPLLYDKQWVYIIRDNKKLQEEVKEKLAL